MIPKYTGWFGGASHRNVEFVSKSSQDENVKKDKDKSLDASQSSPLASRVTRTHINIRSYSRPWRWFLDTLPTFFQKIIKYEGAIKYKGYLLDAHELQTLRLKEETGQMPKDIKAKRLTKEELPELTAWLTTWSMTDKKVNEVGPGAIRKSFSKGQVDPLQQPNVSAPSAAAAHVPISRVDVAIEEWNDPKKRDEQGALLFRMIDNTTSITDQQLYEFLSRANIPETGGYMKRDEIIAHFLLHRKMNPAQFFQTYKPSSFPGAPVDPWQQPRQPAVAAHDVARPAEAPSVAPPQPQPDMMQHHILQQKMPNSQMTYAQYIEQNKNQHAFRSLPHLFDLLPHIVQNDEDLKEVLSVHRANEYLTEGNREKSLILNS